MLVSVILPVYNAEPWIDSCLDSIFKQTYQGDIELSVYNDNSTDQSLKIIQKWIPELRKRNIKVVISNNLSKSGPSGCGFAKNRAIEHSHGEYLCFQDADDSMHPDRILEQLKCAEKLSKDTIIGSMVTRVPENSTVRYTKWINTLLNKELYTQAYTSHGPTVVMPTWFMHRNVYNKVKKFNEGGKGVPEDYIFFLKHLENNGKLFKIDKALVLYRHHLNATTFSVHKDTIWKIRLHAIEQNVLSKWPQFTIWNAGKQGRRFYRDLNKENKIKVKEFCDVDKKKIKKGVYIYEESDANIKPHIPIVHFTHSVPPYVICMKLDLTNGEFEKNLSSLNLTEGIDYFHFN